MSQMKSYRQSFIAWLHLNPIYPLVLAWYPVLLFFQVNIKEVTIKDLVQPMLVTSVIVSAAYLLLRLLWGNWVKPALWLTVAVTLFFSAGHILSLLGSPIHLLKFSIEPSWVLLAVWILILAGCTFLLLKSNRQFARLQLPLNTISLALIGLVLTQIGWHYLAVSGENVEKMSQVNAQRPAITPTPMPITTSSHQPDVYYLVFDKHASPQTLKQVYGYDEQPFLDQLKQLGFYVTQDAHDNYPKTSFSLSSSLNMDYLSNLLPQTKPTSSERSTVLTLFDHNAVGDFLQDKGYTYYNFGSWFEPTQHIEEASVNISPQAGDFLQYDNFSTKLLQTTLYPTLLHAIDPQAPSLDWIDQHRAWADYQYREMPNVIAKPGPKFVFAHILQPHNPFVFDANCQPIGVDKSGPTAIPYYLNQVTCTDTHIIQFIKDILAHSQTQPIIVLQADEGPESMANVLPSPYTFKNANDGAIQERTGILNAYLLPKPWPAQLSETLTPVNSFRMIFDHYFGANFDILPDITYTFADDKHLFSLSDVTDRLK